MGCGETLELDSSGKVRCSNKDCKKRYAVASIIADSETEHIVRIEKHSFSVQHPLRERLNGDLFNCQVHASLKALGGPPKPVGVYRLMSGDWTWSLVEVHNEPT